MAPTEGERLATIEAVLRELRGDIGERKQEEERTRKRLHELEGAVNLLLEAQKMARRAEANQYRRLELRLQLLTIVVAIGSLVVPLAIAFISR